jgi:hypothetical protein
MEYLWDLCSVRITIETAGGKLIFSALPPTWRAEIYLSMAGAKQLGDTRFILVPAGAVHPAEVCSRLCIALHHDACRGELQARRERRRDLQVPEVRLRQSANIMVKAVSV